MTNDFENFWNRTWSAPATSSAVHACNCVGPRNGQPLCPCRMRGVCVQYGRYVEIIDHGPAAPESQPFTIKGDSRAERERCAPKETVGITSSQRDLMVFLQSYMDANGYAPSHDEIAEALGITSKSVVSRRVHQLEDRGLIKILPRRSRAITILRRVS